MKKSNAPRNAAKAAKSSASKKQQSTTTSASKKQSTTAPKEQTDVEKLVAKATKAHETVKSAKADFETASASLQVANHKSHRLDVEVVNLKHQHGVTLSVGENALFNLNRVEVFAQQNGLDKIYNLVANKLKELSNEVATAKKTSKSLNSAIRNLLADWEAFAPIYKSLGLEQSQISASLLKEATPFMLLPTGEGLKVSRVTRRVKRDANGNPLKVDGKKQYEATLVPIVDWDAWSFTSIVITIVLAKGQFSASAEKKHLEFLNEAETALKAVAEHKAEVAAAKAAERKAKADAKASSVPEEVASKEAAAAAHAADAKASRSKAKNAAKAAAPKAKQVAAKAAEAAKKVAPTAKGAAKAARGSKKSA